MNSADLVSVITPAYNASRFVAETIRSVQAQTYQNWEMLIVDDCSTDDTCAVVERISRADERVRLINQPRNSGPAEARNAALDNARGRWLAFLDSDDLWLPTKLERQLTFHESLNATLSFTEYRRISEDGTKVGRRIRVPDELGYRQLLGNTAIVTSSVIIDRLRAGEFRMRKTYYDDFACWLQLLREGGRAVGLHEDLTRYRQAGGSVSRNKGRSAREVWKTYRNIEHLGLLSSSWYFVNYAIRAWLKYRQF